MNTETELRHAVIDRLIAASLSDVSIAREVSLRHWRALGVQLPAAAAPSGTPRPV